eukprot:28201-Eustigmatos_ZCMA.PRE.1
MVLHLNCRAGLLTRPRATDKVGVTVYVVPWGQSEERSWPPRSARMIRLLRKDLVDIPAR